MAFPNIRQASIPVRATLIYLTLRAEFVHQDVVGSVRKLGQNSMIVWQRIPTCQWHGLTYRMRPIARFFSTLRTYHTDPSRYIMPLHARLDCAHRTLWDEPTNYLQFVEICTCTVLHYDSLRQSVELSFWSQWGINFFWFICPFGMLHKSHVQMRYVWHYFALHKKYVDLCTKGLNYHRIIL